MFLLYVDIRIMILFDQWEFLIGPIVSLYLHVSGLVQLKYYFPNYSIALGSEGVYLEPGT